MDILQERIVRLGWRLREEAYVYYGVEQHSHPQFAEPKPFGHPVMSDGEFDALEQEYKALLMTFDRVKEWEEYRYDRRYNFNNPSGELIAKMVMSGRRTPIE